MPLQAIYNLLTNAVTTIEKLLLCSHLEHFLTGAEIRSLIIEVGFCLKIVDQKTFPRTTPIYRSFICIPILNGN